MVGLGTVTFDNQMLSTLIGGAIASFSALIVQAWALWAGRKQRIRNERLDREATAYGLLIKIRDIYSDLESIYRDVYAARANATNLKCELWYMLEPYGTLPPYQEISPAEYVLLFRADQLEIANRLSQIASTHRILLGLHANYAVKRSELARMIGGTPNGKIASTVLTRTLEHASGPLMIDVQSLAENIELHAKAGGGAMDLLSEYNDALKSIIGHKFRMAEL